SQGAVAAWSPLAILLPLAQGGLRRRQPRDRHPVRRAAHVVEADLLAECDRGRVAPMLATDSQLDARARGAAAFGGDADQIAHAVLVQADERVLFEDSLLHVGVQEA